MTDHPPPTPTYTITVETDHPDAARIVADRAQQIAEDLDFEHKHFFDIDLTHNQAPGSLAGWRYDPEEDE